MPSHERHIEEIHYSLRREINELYVMIAIRNFAIALLGVFVPIFVFLYFDRSLQHTILFYIVQFTGHVLFVPVASKLISKLGIKKCMAVGGPFLGIYLILLALAQTVGMAFIVLAIIAKIIYMSLYWPSRHIDFSKFAQTKKRGRQLGTANIIAAVMKTIAPLIGGLVIASFGFTPLFIFSSILLIVSALPLFASQDVYEHYSLSWKQSFAKIFEKKNRKTSLAFFFEGIEYGTGIFIFPIFIFLIIPKLDTIGWITSASLGIALIITYLVGWATDKKGEKKILSIASIAHAFSWLFTSFITNPVQYLVISSFYRIAETANHLPFTSYFYKNAKKRGHGIDEYIVFHEMAHQAGRVTIGLIAIGVASLGITSFFPYFILAAIGAFLFRLIR